MGRDNIAGKDDRIRRILFESAQRCL